MSEERLFELLADRATEGLALSEADELNRLLEQTPEVDDFEWELAAGTIDAAWSTDEEVPLPESLRSRIEADATRVLVSKPAPRSAMRRAPARRRRWVGALGWAAAAALAAIALMPPTGERPIDPASLHRELLAQNALEVSWQATGDASGPEASGDVVWSQERQSGVMRFRGLAVNDPTEFQYQLWIFDGTRDERYPIDGGVFDVARDGEDVFVQIDPKLEVHSPTLFAVTIEKPGGVVVSSRERIAVLATVES